MSPNNRDQTPSALVVAARRLAARRVAALTDSKAFMLPQEWDGEFRRFHALVTKHRRRVFEAVETSDHGVIREDVAAEAGFLLGVEVGKLMAMHLGPRGCDGGAR